LTQDYTPAKLLVQDNQLSLRWHRLGWETNQMGLGAHDLKLVDRRSAASAQQRMIAK
jgi:hypothetical protein